MKNDTVYFQLFIKDNSPIPEVIQKFEQVLGSPLQNFDGLNIPEEHAFFTTLLGLKMIVQVFNPEDPNNRTYEILDTKLHKYRSKGSDLLDISYFLKRVFQTNGFTVTQPQD